ncbi:hypothetical protein ABZP36_004342 [Zizania latifolia]
MMTSQAASAMDALQPRITLPGAPLAIEGPIAAQPAILHEAPFQAPRREITIAYQRRHFKRSMDPPACLPFKQKTAKVAKNKGKEILLPSCPSLQDFINSTKAGMACAPLSTGQIQHTATHICGINAELVTEERLNKVSDTALQLVLAPDLPNSTNHGN